MPKESEKKIWEKERRDRLKGAFNTLEKSLPSYEPSNPLTKIDILTKSIEYIEELKNKILELLKPNCDMNSRVLQLEKLQNRIKVLVKRNEVLCNLLKQAKISIPRQGGILKKSKWNGTLEDKSTKSILNKKSLKSKEQSNNSHGDEFGNHCNSHKIRKSRGRQKSQRKIQHQLKIASKPLLQPATTNCLIIYPQACSTQTYLVNTQSQFSGPQTVITNSILTSNPLMSTGIVKKSASESTSNKVPALNTGTFILTNGVCPIFAPPQSIFPSPVVLKLSSSSENLMKTKPQENQKILNEVASKSKVTSKALERKKINLSKEVTSVKSVVSNIGSISSLARAETTAKTSCKPASNNKEYLTKTTHVNTSPIPALTSKYAATIIIPEIKGLKSGRLNSRPVSRSAFRAARKRMIEKKKLEEANEAAKKKKTESLVSEPTEKTESNVGINMNTETNKTEKANKEEIVKNSNLIPNDKSLDIAPTDRKEVNISVLSNDILVSADDNKKFFISCTESIPVSQNSNNIQSSIGCLSLESKEQAKNIENTALSNKVGIMSIQENNNQQNNSFDAKELVHTQKIRELESMKNNAGDSLKCVKSLKNNLVHPSQASLHLVADTRNGGNDISENPCNISQQSSTMKNLDLQLGHSELSNDIFASLQVPTGCQNPESTSPTAAFLLSFPIVSSMTGVKVTEVIDDDNADSQRETPTILQIGTLDATKTTQSDGLGNNLLNLDSLSFFSSKDIYSGLYNTFEQHLNSLSALSSNNVANDQSKVSSKNMNCDFPKLPNVIMNKETSSNIKNNVDQNITQLVPESFPIHNIEHTSSNTKTSCERKQSENSNNKNVHNQKIAKLNNMDNTKKPNHNITAKANNHTSFNIEGKSDQNIFAVEIQQNNQRNDNVYNSFNVISKSNCQNMILKANGRNSFDLGNQTQMNSEKKNDQNSHNNYFNFAIQSSTQNNNEISSYFNIHDKNNAPNAVPKQNSQSLFGIENQPLQMSMQKKGHNIFNIGSQSTVPNSNDIATYDNFSMKRNESLAPISNNLSANQNIFMSNMNPTRIQTTSELVDFNQLHTKQNFNSQNNNCHIPNTQKFNMNEQNNLFIPKNSSTQISYIDNNNFLPVVTQTSNFPHNLFTFDNIPTLSQKNHNYKSTHDTDKKYLNASQKIIGDSILPLEKKLSNTTNILNNDNKIELLQKKDIPNIFSVDNKNLAVSSQKTIDVNFTFTMENKVVPPLQKHIPQNFNMAYTNANYDLNSITKICSCAYNTSKSFPDPLYTNSNNNSYNYYSNSDNYLNESCYRDPKNEKQTVVEFENFQEYKKNDFNNVFSSDNSFPKHSVPNKLENIQEKPSTYNWMTTPTKNSVVDQFNPGLSKDDVPYSSHNVITVNQTSYFNTSSIYTGETKGNNLGQNSKKNFEVPLVNTNYHKIDTEENQFTWSPTKIPQFLEPVPNFVSSTLPTLVGDLALGTSTFTEQKLEVTKNNTNREFSSKVTAKCNYENQNNLFSVSQLVHQTKENAPTKTTRRRNSCSGSKASQSKHKKLPKSNEDQKEIISCFNKSSGSSNNNNSKHDQRISAYKQPNISCESNKRNSIKVSSTNYSAEALIGHQNNSQIISKKDNVFSGGTMKSMTVPPYIPENIVTYFPPMEIQQDIQQNQNYQNFSSNFTTFATNNYSSNNFVPTCTMTSSYLNTNTFMTDFVGGQEFPTESITMFSNHDSKENKYKNAVKTNSTGRDEKTTPNVQFTNNSAKKAKKKQILENNVQSNLVDFSFLSVPGNINSPVLPDEYHSHTSFLAHPPPQPQLYSCKNSLYSQKQMNLPSTAPLLPLPPIPVSKSGIQHPEISPNLNSAGTSLANFNLSTIFPEINKAPVNDIFPDNTRTNKELNSIRQYPDNSNPINNKSLLNYTNIPTSQSYGIDNR